MRSRIHQTAFAAFVLVFASQMVACTTARAKKPAEPTRPAGQVGVAAWYGGRWIGRMTASGERYRADDMTAAHKTLPFGTYVRVTNLRNNKTVVVRINNRGPYTRGRVLDLSKRAATQLGMMQSGIARVRYQIVSAGEFASSSGVAKRP